MRNMTFQKEGQYIVAYIDGKEVARAKLSQIGMSEQDIEKMLADYQPKLTAGTNITIDENNVISASGGSQLYKHHVNILYVNNTHDEDYVNMNFDIISNSDTEINDVDDFLETYGIQSASNTYYISTSADSTVMLQSDEDPERVQLISQFGKTAEHVFIYTIDIRNGKLVSSSVYIDTDYTLAVISDIVATL